MGQFEDEIGSAGLLSKPATEIDGPENTIYNTEQINTSLPSA